MNNKTAISLESIIHAKSRIKSLSRQLSIELLETPILSSGILPGTDNVHHYLKLENLQTTGSFKIRGAINTLSLLEKSQIDGVLTVSSGNFGLSVSYVARKMGLQSTVLIPGDAPPLKQKIIEEYGGKAIPVQFESLEELMNHIHKLCIKDNLQFIHPFEDPNVAVGHGTLGLELLIEKSVINTVLVPVGSGVFIAGMATALKSMDPSIRVVGVVPKEVSCYANSFHHRKSIVPDNPEQSICDCLRAPFVTQSVLEQGLKYVDELVKVPEDLIIEAMQVLWKSHRLLVEPGACVAAAAAMNKLVQFKNGENVISIITGSNLALDKALGYLELHQDL